jgi:predicted HAD superfamily Cof-like phosphohydrolase
MKHYGKVIIRSAKVKKMIKTITNFGKVGEFMETFNQEMKETPDFPSDEIIKLREKLIAEEFKEYCDAVANRDIVGIADALSDLLYVVYGAGHAYGIDLDLTFNLVHDSNMSKLGPDGKPMYREDGKVMKGPNFHEPDLSIILK